MITLSLTPQQFIYLQAAVKRDLENLEEMAPWDDQIDEHAADVATCKAVGRLLKAAEQTQVSTH